MNVYKFIIHNMKNYILTFIITLLVSLCYSQNPKDSINAEWKARVIKTTNDRYLIELTAIVPKGWWLMSEVEYQNLISTDIKIFEKKTNKIITTYTISHDKKSEYISSELNKNIEEELVVLDKEGIFIVEISHTNKGKEIEILIEYLLVNSESALYPKPVRLTLKL